MSDTVAPPSKRDRRPYWREYSKQQYALKKLKKRQPVDIPTSLYISKESNTVGRPTSQIEKWQHRMIKELRKRAAVHCTPFDLSTQDLKVPTNCPVFGVPLNIDHPSLKPSVDRVDSSLGYHRDNICVMSLRANLLKSDATLDELICLGKWAARTRTILADKKENRGRHSFGYRPKNA